MDNGSASAGASSHLTDNSARAASSPSSVPDASTNPALSSSSSSSLACPRPPVPWSEPPVPSPLPHPPLLGSNVSFPSPARRSSAAGSGVRFTDPSSSPSSPSVSHSIAPLISPPPPPPAPPLAGASPARAQSGGSSSTISSSSSSSPSSAGSTSLSSSGSSSVSSLGASPDKTSSATVLMSTPSTSAAAAAGIGGGAGAGAGASAGAGAGASTSIPSNGGSPSRSFRNPGSPTYSAFASASDSPFFSPSTPTSATPFLTPPSGSFSSSAIHTPRGDRAPPAVVVRPNPALLVSPLRESPFSPPQYGASSGAFQSAAAAGESPGPSFLRTAASPGSTFLRQSTSPTSAGRPRSCDVFISLYGQCPALVRFAKWMRAELELQGVACFSADRSLFSDTRSHDISRRIMNSATFGVVIISRSVFRNRWTMEELRVFLDRRNLVPVFFDLAPADIAVQDIVQRRGKIWEKHGGELWAAYDGDEAEWKDVVHGVLRSEEWRLEAHDGNWRACIRKAVSLLGTRLGRRSIAERERVQTERIDVDEFPFPRNASFTGREKELKHLEEMLSLTMDYPQQELQEPSRKPGDPADSSSSQKFRGASSSAAQQQQLKGKELEEEIGIQPSGGRPEIEADKEAAAALRGREPQRGRDMQRGRQLHRERHMQRKREAHNAKDNVDPTSSRNQGCACISGAAGIGKTELALEYAYRNTDKYRTILWLSAENRYIRQNYLNLAAFLGVDVGSETQAGPDRARVRSFDEQETDAYQRIKREMSRDVPYLLIVDNLESERDWWDGKEITELLPSPGGASHVIITTRLPRVMHLKCIELSTLSNTEAVDLMRGGRHLSPLELEALRDIDEKLARLTLGLAIVSRLLAELHIMPSELLELMGKAEGITDVRNREDEVLRNNPHLFRLLNVCMALLESSSGPVKLAAKMALVGGWFAPVPIPFDLLAQAASTFREKSPLCKCWRSCTGVVFWCCMASKSRRAGGEAAYLLIQYGVARRASRQGCVYFSDVVQVFLRRRGGVAAARAVVQGVRRSGVLALHLEQFWAACFLVLRFGNDPVTVELRVPELLSFTRKVVLPLALRTFSSFTRCQAALELLHLCFNGLDDIEKSFVSQIGDKSFCWRRAKGRSHQVDDYVWHDLTLLKAHLLETRAKLLLRGGLCDAGEELCRTCISIRMVMLGAEHPDTISAQETLAKLVRARNNA
ncbi:protein MpNBS-LRR16 [Marchantia polymorpha subsp. ruderalis]|nr:hypothetical protein MARPO_0134s0035 [Marchantia polymorpha]BBN12399.1 hypothetical protein Mp_5g19770 [Marchantia polymorpha subsp. ruderalis]|eukprot:PTQ29824.1 hypothetical protein MARPO_0134s0035 [Marchantia polymorpha]